MRVLLLLCVLLTGAQAWAQAAGVGAITQIQGAASVTRGTGTQTLTAGAGVFSDDILETAADGKLLVTFSDGSKLTLGPNAEVVIDEFVYSPAGGTNTAALRVTAGAMRLVAGAVERVGGAQAVTVATPVGSIGIRGTDFFVEMEDGTHLAVALFSGFEVAVTNAAGETVLRPGEGTDVWADAAPSQALTWGTERVNRALALVTITPDRRPFYYAQPMAPADTVQSALIAGTFKLDTRLRYELRCPH